MLRMILAGLTLLLAAAPGAARPDAPTGQSAPTPRLTYVFSVRAEVAPAVEQGSIDGGRRRFVAITGGAVYGPRLQGVVLPGGGDWQVIKDGGVTSILARYFLRSADGAVIEVTNPGVRVAAPEVIEQLARGEAVDPSRYYFRTTPQFATSAKQYDWLHRAVFVARGIRRPDHVVIDYFLVE
jgi:Protein of unknown function (DUF3237)